MAQAKVRLYVDHPLARGQTVPVSQEQAHYLFGVMRLTVGAEILVFNGRDGEWRAGIAAAGRKGGTLSVGERTRPLVVPPDLWLLFAPIKKARTDFIVEKAAELGVARILPVQTEFTNSDRLNRERLQAHAVEAAEQCGGTFVPEVADIARLDRVLEDWDPVRLLMWADEALEGHGALSPSEPGPWAILIGPEGGFSEAERLRLRRLPFVRPVGLGPRILRADTAAVAAITMWQLALGDWR